MLLVRYQIFTGDTLNKCVNLKIGEFIVVAVLHNRSAAAIFSDLLEIRLYRDKRYIHFLLWSKVGITGICDERVVSFICIESGAA